MAVTKEKLSASTNGRQVKVAATATAGTTIHTAAAGTTSWDEVWLFATNHHSAAVTLTIEWGGTTSPDDLVKIVLQPLDPTLVIAGAILQNALVVRAFATQANLVVIHGYVNRITAL